MILQNKYNNQYCGKCGEKYTDINNLWCKPCQTKKLKRNFASWTSKNKKIDNFIREMQLKINKYNDVIFEWITYHQFKDIKRIGKKKVFATAIWKDGPLYYNTSENKLMRKPYEKVALQVLHHSQNITNEFSNKV